MVKMDPTSETKMEIGDDARELGGGNDDTIGHQWPSKPNQCLNGLFSASKNFPSEWDGCLGLSTLTAVVEVPRHQHSFRTVYSL